jgi:hypothetical protein
LLFDAGSPTRASDLIYVGKTDGTVLATLTSPNSSGLSNVAGCPVHLDASLPDYFAVLAYPRGTLWQRSVLSIFDPKGKLVYEEVLPETCACLAVLPAASDTMSEALLVGGTNHIWRYGSR